MDQKETLKNLGLSDAEVEIYLSLLRLGGARASVVAKDIGIKRTTVYPTLKKLAKAGFVRVYYSDNRRTYYAQEPKQVAALFGKKLDSFLSIVPLLESLEYKTEVTSGLRYIETVDELKEFYIGVLDEYRNKEYRIIGSTIGWESLDPEFFVQFSKERARNKIKTKLLLTDESKTLNPTDNDLLRECRYLPPEYTFKSIIDIFDDKILIIGPQLYAVAVVIEISAMVDVFYSLFAFMWDSLE